MITKYASKAQLTIAGSPLQPTLDVGMGSLLGITAREQISTAPVRALNYTISPIAIINQTIDIAIFFTYTYQDSDNLFDFTSLPYASTNIQVELQNIEGTLIAIYGGAFYKGSFLEYNLPGIPVRRVIQLGATSVQTIPQL